MQLSGTFKRLAGFTLIEIMLTIAILSLIFGMSYYSLFVVYRSSLLRGSTETVASAFQMAVTRAQTGEFQAYWGVYLDYDDITRIPTAVTVFAGNSYATRDTQYDITYSLPGRPYVSEAYFDGPAVSLGDDHEVVFSPLTADTTDYGYVSLAGDLRGAVINISPHGMINVE